MREISSNQRVGLLSGLGLLLGSLMTAYFANAELWAWVTFVSLFTIVWLQARVSYRESSYLIARSGFIVVLLATLVARVLGWLVARVLLGEWRVAPGTEYDVINGEIIDINRVILNGTFGQSLLLALILAGFAALVSAASVWVFNQTRQRRTK